MAVVSGVLDVCTEVVKDFESPAFLWLEVFVERVVHDMNNQLAFQVLSIVVFRL